MYYNYNCYKLNSLKTNLVAFKLIIVESLSIQLSKSFVMWKKLTFEIQYYINIRKTALLNIIGKL